MPFVRSGDGAFHAVAAELNGVVVAPHSHGEGSGMRLAGDLNGEILEDSLGVDACARCLPLARRFYTPFWMPDTRPASAPCCWAMPPLHRPPRLQWHRLLLRRMAQHARHGRRWGGVVKKTGDCRTA